MRVHMSAVEETIHKTEIDRVREESFCLSVGEREKGKQVRTE